MARGFDDFTMERVVTTLVVACPHALGLAIPLVIAISTTLRRATASWCATALALEQARNVDMVVFDKTGTLTRGEQGLVGSLRPTASMRARRSHWRQRSKATAST